MRREGVREEKREEPLHRLGLSLDNLGELAFLIHLPFFLSSLLTSRLGSDTTYLHKPTTPPVLRLAPDASAGYLEGAVDLPVDGVWQVKVCTCNSHPPMHLLRVQFSRI